MYREDIIIPLVTGKRVLDCGGIDHWAMDMKLSRGDWLHAIIAEHAASTVGIDILEDAVRRINNEGKYHFIIGNVEELSFNDKFEVIVAGEIVEHIYNMGLFLDSAWRALQVDGILIITTPNYHAISSVITSAVFGKERCHPEHTCYYSKQTLSYIVEKHGFQVREVYMLSRPAHSRIVQFLRSLVIRVRPTLAEQLVLVAHKLPHQPKYESKW